MLPAEIGWTACSAIIEEHYEPDFAVMVRLHEADRSTRHDVAART
jgi:hypothetical protein